MRVLFLDTVHPILWEKLTEEGFECHEDLFCSKSELQKKISKYDGLVLRGRITLDQEILEYSTNLKFIARSGSGLENIDVKYAESKGIACLNSPEGNANAVGEHALGMLLSLMHKISNGDREIRVGKWDREGNRGFELNGLTIGIIGYGHTGSSFAQKLTGFECEIWPTIPSNKSLEAIE